MAPKWFNALDTNSRAHRQKVASEEINHWSRDEYSVRDWGPRSRIGFSKSDLLRLSFTQHTYTQLYITGTPPLTRFFGPGKNSVKGKPRNRRSILVVKPQTGEFVIQSPLFAEFLLVLNCIHIFHKVKRNLMQGTFSNTNSF